MIYNLMTFITFIEEGNISTIWKLHKFTLKNTLPSIIIENNLKRLNRNDTFDFCVNSLHQIDL